MPPPPPPPPPGPPPPPTLGVANTTPPKLNKKEQVNRGALLGDISKGMKLKKTSHLMVDKSKPAIGGENIFFNDFFLPQPERVRLLFLKARAITGFISWLISAHPRSEIRMHRLSFFLRHFIL